MGALRDDVELVAIVARLQPLADDAFAPAGLAGDPVGIDGCGVDGSAAEADILIEDFECCFAAVEAEGSGAEDDAI